jgi:hypothetical protein
MSHDVPSDWFLLIAHGHSIDLAHHLIRYHDCHVEFIGDALQVPQELTKMVLPNR